MNTDERKEKVKKIIEKKLFQVFGGSIQATELAAMTNEIDLVYVPHLKEEEEPV